MNDEDDSTRIYEEFDRWDKGPVVQFNFYLDDAFVSALDGRRYHSPHSLFFLLDPAKDGNLIVRILKYRPEIMGVTAILRFPEGSILTKKPETVEEAIREYERASQEMYI